MTLSKYQRSVLQCMADGLQLRYHHDMGWFQRGHHTLGQATTVREVTVNRLREAGLIAAVQSPRMGRPYTDYALTDEGKKALNGR